MLFNNLDILIVVIYCVGIVTIAQYVSKSKQGQEKTAEDYFLAGRSLPWWAIGASLIAANISAEQIIGMSGQGYANQEKAIELSGINFKTETSFNISTLIICGILIGTYLLLW